MITELRYTITEQDFVDYNLYFVEHDPITQKNIWKLRWIMAGMAAIGGTGLMYALDVFHPMAIVAYLALAVVCFLIAPAWVRRNVKKNVYRTIQRATNKHICGQKTLYLHDDKIQLVGQSEDSEYGYEAFKRVTVADRQVYLYLDDISALIIPNDAFSSEQDKISFVQQLEARIAQAKREAKPTTDQDIEEN